MIFVWMFLGLIAGLLTKWLLLQQSSEGIVGTMLLGMTGAMIGGLFAQGFGWQDSNPEDLVLVMLGAMLALVIYWQLVETEELHTEMVHHH